jgi:hypothetical protein
MRCGTTRTLAINMWRPVLLSLGLLTGATAHAQVTHVFGGGAGEVTVPLYYDKVEDRDASLVLVSRPEGNVRLYFDLHKLDAAVRVKDPGVALVKEVAKEKNKRLHDTGDRVAFFDPSPPGVKDGRTVLYLHWQIGFGKTVVIMSAHVPQDARDAPDVKRFLSGDIEAIISSLRRVDG